MIGHVRGGVVLELRYDGTAPPLALLDSLRCDGWRDATAAPPPAHAIDWSTPDPLTGRAWSLRSWDAVTTTTFLGDEAKRNRAVSRTRDLLVAAGLELEAPPTVAPVVDPVPVEVVEPEPPRSERRVRRWRGVEVPSAEDDQPVLVESTPGGPRVAEPADGVVLEVVCHQRELALVRARLERVGVVRTQVEEMAVAEVTYRGNRSEVATPVVRVVAVVEARAADQVVAALSAERIHSIERR